jgi:outer membrane receptor protein involved in Fe transport
MKRFVHTQLSVLVCLVVLSNILFAGSTGKIAGKVTDAATGEPIVGANALVVGTLLGAATNIEGKYTIVGVPIGSFSVRISLVGYQDVLINEVNVSSDQTTPLNVKLTSAAVEMKEIVITAEQLVNPLTTSSVQTVNQRTIEMIPNVKSVQDVMALQAGVVKMGGNTFLRGGRANEVQYVVDGIPVNNIIGNSGELTPTSSINEQLQNLYSGVQTGVIGGGTTGLAVSANAIQSVSVQTSGFDADFGNSQSGIVNIITKSGGERYTGSVQYRTDQVAKPNFSETYGSVNIGGPEPITKYLLPQLGVAIPGTVTFFFSSDMNRSDGAYRYDQNRFYNPLERKLEFHGFLGGLLNGLGFRYRDDQRNSFTINSKLKYDVSSGDQLSYGYRASLGSGHDYYKDWKYRADSSSVYTDISTQHVLTWTHFFSQSTFSRLSLGRVESNSRNDVGGLTPDKYSWANRNTDINGDNFNDLGTGQRWYNALTNVYTLRFDFNSQVHPLHFLKTGFEFNYEEIASTEIKYPMISLHGNPVPDTARLSTGSQPDRGEYPGYGIYRWALNNYPNRGALYVQDNIEFEGLNLHVGLRYDYIDLGKQVDEPDFVQAWENAAGVTPDVPEWPDKKIAGSTFLYYFTHGKVSPRLSIGYPVTNRIVFYFNYGHFTQYPERDQYYRDPFVLGDDRNWIGNPDLKPQRTVQYEAGFESQVSDDLAFAVRAFYKDIFDYATLVALPLSTNNGYVNLDYASARGFELTLNKSFTGGFSASTTYTYQIAKGRESNPLAYAFNPDIQLPRETRLDWDQQHTANLFVSYKVGPKDQGLFGWSWANNYGASLTWSLGSGFPYTAYRPRINERNVLLVNNETKPFTSRVNLSINKGFYVLNQFNVLVTLDVENLLNRKNVNNINTFTGQPSKYGDYDPDVREVYEWYRSAYRVDPTNFDPGRQILFGMKVNWE